MQTSQPIPADELHEALSEVHYDLYKDMHGISPRWMNYEAMTVGQVEAELLELQAEIEAAIVWDAFKAQEAEKVAAREEGRVVREQWMDRAQAHGCPGW